jgi:hypothetical protein
MSQLLRAQSFHDMSVVKEGLPMYPPRLSALLILALCNDAGANAAPRCGAERFPRYQLEYCMHPAPGPLLVLDAAQGTDMQVCDQAFIKEINGFASVLTFNRIGSGKHQIGDQIGDRPRFFSFAPIILLGHAVKEIGGICQLISCPRGIGNA